jgi:ketosteroid isomerase-like protein
VSEANIEQLKRGYELLATGDLGELAAMVDPEFELTPSLAGASEQKVYRGPEGLRQYVLDLGDAWERFDQVPERFIDCGDDRILVITRVEAVGKRSGIVIKRQMALLWTIRDGKAVRGVGFLDAEEALAAVAQS